MSPVFERFVSKRFAITAAGVAALIQAGRYGLAAAVTITYTVVQGVIDVVNALVETPLPHAARIDPEPDARRPRRRGKD